MTAQPTEQRPVHLQTTASAVECGAPMRHYLTRPDGWDLGNCTTQVHLVTCEACTPRRAVCSECGKRYGNHHIACSVGLLVGAVTQTDMDVALETFTEMRDAASAQFHDARVRPISPVTLARYETEMATLAGVVKTIKAIMNGEAQ